jgi:signal transduction histidine kinase
MTGSRPAHVEGLGAAAIAVILVLGTALSVLLALNLRRQQDIEIDAQTEARAMALSRIGVAEVNQLYTAMQRRGALWASLFESDRLNPRLEVFMEENPSIVALAYPAGSDSIAGAPEAAVLLRGWQQEARAPDATFGPATLADGRQVLGANLRISYLADDQRSVFGVFEPRRLLHPIFVEAAGAFDFALSLGDEELMRRDASKAPDDLVRFAKQIAIAPPSGEAWTLSVWPTTAAIPASYRQGPIVALAAGVLASGLIAIALHFGALAWNRARILADANLALGQQIDDTRRGQGELQKLSSELEMRVAERTAELNETIAELQTFNYSVSHDLRSPLAAIINFAAIFGEDYAGRLDDTQIEYLQRISTSATAAVGLMDALLSYSHSGRTELRRVNLNVRSLVREVCDETLGAIPERRCEVKIGDLPDAWADETMLRFIFSNLLSNACKFSKPGEMAIVEVGGKIEGAECVYYVRDDGVGFDPRFAHKLFKAFERLHRSNEYAGTGVGLAIVGRMVRRHGGRVWAQGAVGKGATFHFSIPNHDGGSDGTRTT